MEWAWLEHGIQDFDTFEEAYNYFRDTYFGDLDALKQRFICVVNEKDEFAGCVIAWKDRNGDDWIPAVHWLAVSPREQGRGIGRALVQKLMERFLELDGLPVYLHSQPCSYVAVGLYSSLGFRALKSESIMGYDNQFDEAMTVLKPLMPPEKYKKLLDEAIG